MEDDSQDHKAVADHDEEHPDPDVKPALDVLVNIIPGHHYGTIPKDIISCIMTKSHQTLRIQPFSDPIISVLTYWSVSCVQEVMIVKTSTPSMARQEKHTNLFLSFTEIITSSL